MPFVFHPDIKTYHFQSSFLREGVINIYPYLIENRERLPFKEEFVYFPLTYFFLGTYQALALPFLGNGFNSWLFDASQRVVSNPNIFRYLFILKLPYLLIDVLIAFLLTKFFKDKKLKNEAFTLWLFNPFTIVLIYFFSNVDIIPVLLILVTIILLNRNKIIGAASTLALATMFKAFPLVLFPYYVVKLTGIKKMVTIIILFSTIVFVFLALFWSQNFVDSALVSGLTTRVLNNSGNLFVVKLISPTTLGLSLVGLLYLKNRKKVQLWEITLVVFLVMLIFIRIHVQWLLWIAPFLVLFYVNNKKHLIPVILVSVFSILIPLTYNDRFMNFALLGPISDLSFQLPTIYTAIQKVGDPLIFRKIFQGILILNTAFVSYVMLFNKKS